MKLNNSLLITFFLLFFTVTSFSQNKADDIKGIWLTADGKAKVKIYKKSNEYYGTIIWLKEGEPLTDNNNPDSELRKKNLVGLEIMKSLVFDDSEWDDGTIYDPENGSTYSVLVEMTNKNVLKLRGYIGFSLLGRTEYWTRVSG